jgi:hypothetical protein
MKQLYILLGIFCGSIVYAGEAPKRVQRLERFARDLNLTLPTETSKKKASKSNSPRSAKSPQSAFVISPRVKELKKAASSDSILSSPEDTAQYTRTIVPGLYNRVLGLTEFAKTLKNTQCLCKNQNDAAAYGELSDDFFSRVARIAHEIDMISDQQKAAKEEDLAIAKLLGKKIERTLMLSSEEQDLLDSLIDVYEKSIIPEIQGLKDIRDKIHENFFQKKLTTY